LSESDRKPPAEPGRGISALESAQIAAFAAFRRPVGDADKAFCADAVALQRLGAAQAGCHINPSLTRSLYAGIEGTIHVVPGAGNWITVADPVDMFWTRQDRSTHQAPAGLFKPGRIL
jgi:hypothetical protein